MLFSIERASSRKSVKPCDGAVVDGERRDLCGKWVPRWVVEVPDLSALLALGVAVDSDLIVSGPLEQYERNGAKTDGNLLIYDGYIE